MKMKSFSRQRINKLGISVEGLSQGDSLFLSEIIREPR